MKLHPATQILIWCVLVTAIQFLSPLYLLSAGALILGAAFLFSRHKLLQLVRRTRWIMISLWLIYAYTLPGQALFDGPFSPSLDGLREGALQLMRLLAALAGLAILLDRLHRLQLIAGLYALFFPLSCMLRAVSWQDSLRSLFEVSAEADHTLALPVYRVSLVDAVLLAGAVLMLWLSLR
jgi:energy-coupling factor transporter transmembrane protein EcfT